MNESFTKYTLIFVKKDLSMSLSRCGYNQARNAKFFFVGIFSNYNIKIIDYNSTEVIGLGYGL